MIESIYAKLRRAELHRHTFMRLYDQLPPTVIHPQIDLAKNEIRFYRPETPLPEYAALALADAFHNARAALDQIAFALVVSHAGAIAEKVARGIQFPLLDAPRELTSVKGLVREADLHRIWELQPFNSTNPTVWGDYASPATPCGLPELLRYVHRVDNLDKHRFSKSLRREVTYPREPDFLSEEYALKCISLMPPAKFGDPFAVWEFDKVPPTLPPDIDWSHYFPESAQFNFLDPDHGQQMYDIGQAVAHCIHAVGTVATMFEPSIERGEGPAPLPVMDPTPIPGMLRFS